MANSESFSALCAYRNAEPNAATRKFLEKVQAIANQEVGYTDSALVKSPVVNPQAGSEDSGASAYQGIGISTVDVYKEVDLKVIMFQRAAPIGMNLGPTYAQAHAAVSAPYTETRPRRQRFIEETEHVRTQWENPVQLMLRQVGLSLDIPDQDRIRVQYTGIQENFVPGTDNREYALTPKCASRATDLLNEQARKLFVAYHGVEDGDDVAYPAAPSVINMPIFNIPVDVDVESRHKMIDRVQAECLQRPLVVPMGRVNFDYHT